MKAAPPIGVMAPNVRTPVRHRTYKLPENKNTPTTNNQPAARTAPDVQRPAAQPTAKKAKRMDELIPDPRLEDRQHLRRQPPL